MLLTEAKYRNTFETSLVREAKIKYSTKNDVIIVPKSGFL
jgi:esterase/lipase superfamily enzyme